MTPSRIGNRWCNGPTFGLIDRHSFSRIHVPPFLLGGSQTRRLPRGAVLLAVKEGRGLSSVRVLVVEDFAPFRKFICSTLGKRPNLRVICEVSDGQDAVQKAEELKPDLILLDIGLPTLDGFAAARQIRKLAPACKIIFVSQESSTDVVQEAFNIGAWGYVLKETAASDLLAAVEAVLEGKQFVSGGLFGP